MSLREKLKLSNNQIKKIRNILFDKDYNKQQIEDLLSFVPGTGMPVSFWPNEMYHSGDNLDAWDRWENKRFNSNWDTSHFSRGISIIKNQVKWNRKSKFIIDSDYDNSDDE